MESRTGQAFLSASIRTRRKLRGRSDEEGREEEEEGGVQGVGGVTCTSTYFTPGRFHARTRARRAAPARFHARMRLKLRLGSDLDQHVF